MCAQPILNPALPFVGAIPGGLQPGRMIRVQGMAHPTARCFSINLQCGPGSSSQDDIALHLSPVFSPPPRLVRNSLQNQQWGPEESHGPYFPFTVGQHFEILILTEGDEYKIAVNGQHFCEFKHRIPIYRITSLSINGDATINQINYEGTVSPIGGGMQQPSAGGFSGGFLPPTATSPSCPPPYSIPNPTPQPPPPTSYGQQPYPTQPGVPYQTSPYGGPPLPPGSNPYGTPPVPPGSIPYGASPYGAPPGSYHGAYPQATKQSGGLGSLLPSGLAAGIGALAGSTLLGKGMKDSGKGENSNLTTAALKTGIGLLAEAAAVSTAEPKGRDKKGYDQIQVEGKGNDSSAENSALAVGVELLTKTALASMKESKERERMGDIEHDNKHEGKGKDSSAADAALAVGVGILTNAALSSVKESKPENKDEKLSDFAAGIGKLTEAAVVSMSDRKHQGHAGHSNLASSALAAGVEFLSETAANSIHRGGYHGYPYGKPKSSSPIPIGLAAGAGALAGAAMLGKSPSSKMKENY